jgi:peptide/nickel transport system permease protein
MYGGRISLIVSFLAVFIITLLGVVLGGIAGYFGGWVDNVIMRICDILMCLPGIPILLIVGTIIDGWAKNYPDIPIQDYRIYILMAFLSLISWTGTARLVRGQILSLREQEYMVAAEAMGYSTGRKIFKHLIPNVMPQLIVQMTLSLGSMILYEATLSYLNLGVREPQVAWGTMISIISSDMNILQNHFNVWGSAGICIVIAVLGFNFVGDGLRDALDPKMRR